MSRIGKLPVQFGKDVQISMGSENSVTVKGPKTSLTYKMRPSIKGKLESGMFVLVRSKEDKETKSLHGLYRALLNNAVVGVTRGFTKILEINGVGFKANVAGKKLELNLGFTHVINYDIPSGIEIKVEKNTKVTITGADRALVGLVASQIRAYKEPEPYQGKGIKYDTEVIRRKAGKSVSK